MQNVTLIHAICPTLYSKSATFMTIIHDGVYLQGQRVERIFLVHQAVDDRLRRAQLLKRPEHPVPYDQDTSIVLVQTVQGAPWEY